MKTPSTLKLPPDAPETSTPSAKALAQIIQAHTKATEQLAAAMERQNDALAQIAALVSHLGQVVVNAAEDAAEPFIVPVTHAGDLRSHPISEPFRTITGAHRGEHALIAPFFVPRHGEHSKQKQRCRSVEQPMPTVTATANGAGLVATFLAQHNEGMVGHSMQEPVSTITAKGSHQQLVSAFLAKLYGTCKDGQDLAKPFPTVRAGGMHLAEVRAFLVKYYSSGGQWQGLREPMHTLPTKARMGLVTVAGIEYQIVDIGMRMLTPRELFRAQGFPDSYVIDRTPDGREITKTDQIRLCGNSVCPDVAKALVEANFANESMRVAA